MFSNNADHDKTLFKINVTKDYLEQWVLGLVLICKSSYRSIQLFLSNLFDKSAWRENQFRDDT